MNDELIHIVNEQDEVIGTMSRRKAHAECHLLRIAAVLVFNKQGQVVLQRESKHSRKNALKWVYSAAGHVAAQETYEEAAVREMKEELGIDGVLDGYIGLVRCIHERTGKLGPFHHVFRVYHDGPYVFDKQEAEEIQLFNLADLPRLIHENPDEFSDYIIECFKVMKII